MKATRTVLLHDLQRVNVPLEEVLSESERRSYHGPLARVIADSERIAARSLEPWTYKSIADYGAECFCTSSAGWAWRGNKGDDARFNSVRFWHAASEEYSQHMTSIPYDVEKGLALYIRTDDGAYLEADDSDSNYLFLTLLNHQGGAYDLEFTTPPQWASELYLQRESFEAFQLLWWNVDREYERAKAFRRAALLAHRRGLFDESGPLVSLKIRQGHTQAAVAGQLKKGPLDAEVSRLRHENRAAKRREGTLLVLIGALCEAAKIPPGRGAAQRIKEATEGMGAPVDDQTIRSVLREVAEAVAAKATN